ncbi:APO protein 2 [Rhynchospora pubera]|uniref:APO protein 2 n=1 Tax=Rhynchospora pubera TaxID=906938 RepID=A0AAV8AQQ0_9POAL|nr:APO protein 2 [Rhynchospora pubera]KAJ4792914.1 APO protein 2 [Rhynchospora pubera]
MPLMAAEVLLVRSSSCSLLPSSSPFIPSSSNQMRTSPCRCLLPRGAPLSGFFGCRLTNSSSTINLFSTKEELSAYAPKLRWKRTGGRHISGMVIKCNYPQNADLPRYYSKKEKKPFPVPIVELRRAARERIKNAKGKPRIPTLPPRNGMLVKSLIPVAYEVMNARVTLINNLKRLLKAVPVQACKYCNEIHVGSIGHPFKSCRGLYSNRRNGTHDWTRTFSSEDIFVSLECFHLSDRLGPRITHQERFSVPRAPAIVELCIQAGVDLPDLPTKRRRKPVIRVGRKEIIDANEDDLPEPKPNKHEVPILDILPDEDVVAPLSPEETAQLADETIKAWETVRQGVARLMRKYTVRVCGYCPEVHVGPTGHKAQNCGAHKHQQRNGQHGWQAAVLDNLFPPRYVWHMPESGEELKRELKNFYGQAPAVVEMCVQAGCTTIPDEYKSTMRLNVGIPASLKEAEMVV